MQRKRKLPLYIFYSNPDNIRGIELANVAKRAKQENKIFGEEGPPLLGKELTKILLEKLAKNALKRKK